MSCCKSAIKFLISANKWRLIYDRDSPGDWIKCRALVDHWMTRRGAGKESGNYWYHFLKSLTERVTDWLINLTSIPDESWLTKIRCFIDWKIIFKTSSFVTLNRSGKKNLKIVNNAKGFPTIFYTSRNTEWTQQLKQGTQNKLSSLWDNSLLHCSVPPHWLNKLSFPCFL